MNRIFLVGTLLCTALGTLAQAELRMPSLFGDHMVLQRDQENRVWGWAPGESEVTVAIAGQSVSAKTGEKGRWEAVLAAIPTNAEGLEMTVTAGSQSLKFSDILVGEVWVCSGQSNMQWSVAQSYDPDLEALTAKYPQIRFISVPQVGTQEIQDDFVGQWEACTPETVVNFSAVGYAFGKQLHQTLDVPIGLIDNAWGGSAAEAWVRRDVLEADPDYTDYIAEWAKKEESWDFDAQMKRWKEQTAKAKAEGKRAPRQPRDAMKGQHRPGNLYAGVLHPIIGYGIRGTIWYQGETNAARAWNYRKLFPMMISHWREEWGQGDFPFYWVQLADFQAEVDTPGDSNWAELREAQSHSLKLPNTGQAVIVDIGEGRDIHPRNKEDVGKRLARIALARDYNYDLVYQSPTYDSMAVEGKVATLTFKNVGKRGLYAFDRRDVVGFAVAGEDKVWHWAQGQIHGANQVRVWSDAVATPVAVRYAWATNPVANLTNWEGLPADPFRTDDWQVTTQK